MQPACAWVSLSGVSPCSFTPGAPTLPIGTTGESTTPSQTPVILAAFGKITNPLNLQIGESVSGIVSMALTTALPPAITARFNPPVSPLYDPQGP